MPTKEELFLKENFLDTKKVFKDFMDRYENESVIKLINT